MSLAPGTLLGHRYEVQAFLGLGGPVESYQALDLRLGRDVSIASMDLHNQSPESLLRFERAAQQRASFQHPRVVTVHDFGQESHRIFLVSEWLVGQSLRRRLKCGKLSWPEATRVCAEVLEGLAAARSQGCLLPFPDTAWIFLEESGNTRLLAYLGLDNPDDRPLTQAEETGKVADLLLSCCELGQIPAPIREQLEHWSAHPQQADPAALQTILATSLSQRTASSPRRKWAVAAAALTVVGLALATWSWTRPQPDGASTVAVLPFIVSAEQTDMDYLGSGISQHLAQALGRIPGLRVALPGAEDARTLKDDTLRLGQRLKVEWLIRGQLNQQGATFRIEAELLRASDGRVARRFTVVRPTRDLLALADELTGEILVALRQNRGPLHRTDPAGTQDTEAYRLYLQGRHFLASREADQFRRAQASFQAAIARDPNYARAHSGLADTYNLMGAWRLVPPLECGRLATDAAQKALALDPTLAEAHASLAYARFRFFFDWEGAEQGFLEALRRDPDFAQGHHWYGFFLSILGRWEEAFLHLRQAVELEPMSLPARTQLAVALHWAGRSQEALDEFRKVFDVDPSYRNGLARYRWTLEELGRLDEALQVAGQEVKLESFPANQFEELRTAFTTEGAAGYWKARFRQFESGSDPIVLAAAAVQVGNHSRAIAALEQAWRGRVVSLVWVPRMPSFAALKSDPRFMDLMRRIGLPLEAPVAGKPRGR